MEMILGILVVVFIVMLVIVIRLWTNCKSDTKKGSKKKRKNLDHNSAEFESLDVSEDPIVETL